MCKIFADDTSLFSKVVDVNKSVIEDLEKINQWAYQWKMQINPDPNKQANEVISSNLSHPPIKFNEIIITPMQSSQTFRNNSRLKS